MKRCVLQWMTAALGFVAAGCAARLPMYPWIDQAHALDIMADRTERIETVSSPCRVILADPARGSTQLDGVIVTRPPDFFRLRAWKFSQTVLDVTLTPDGLWIFTAEHRAPAGSRAAPFTALTTEQFSFAASLMMGRMTGDGWSCSDAATGHGLLVERAWGTEASVRCEVDRPTLTCRRCRVTRAAGETVLTLSLDRYRRFGDLVVPARVVMRSERGTVTMLLDDLSLNDELPPRAFDPPRRAVKQP